VHAHKIKKAEDGITAPQIAMTENPDILRAVAQLPQPPYCVGFAAESEKLAEHAEAKRRRKGIPLIVANLGPATFGRDDNALLLIDATTQRELSRADKLSLARELIQEISVRI
jgi:phosphopantothenoylcysteine decarboxylase/phosphopantothenate--cysteine ligase